MATQGELTVLPNGILATPVIGGGPQIPTSTGQYFFVSNNQLGSVETYYTSIGGALAQCVAGRGDVIICEPGYIETIVSATALDLNVAGVSVVGLGNKTQRPSIVLSTATTATLTISASGVTLQNFTITTAIDELAVAMTVTGNGATIDSVDYVETATLQTIKKMVVTGKGVSILNSYDYQKTAPTGTGPWITLTAADRAKIVGNKFFLTQANNVACSAIGGLTTASVDLYIGGNSFYTNGGTSITHGAINLLAASTGIVEYNNSANNQTTQAGAFALASAMGFQNFSTNAVNTSGILDPAADT